jgi:F0F1-type ATP synthase assembly protein I
MEIKMYKKFISALYVINIVSQAIFTLLTPIALGFGISWLLVEYAAIPSWIYAVLITLGALIGFYSMIKFVLSAMASLDRLEKSRSASKKTDNTGNNNGQKRK